MSCEPSALFRQQEYTLPQVPEFLKVQTQHQLSHRQVLDPDFWRFIHFSLQTLATWRRLLQMKETVTFFPFFVHTFFLSLFASIIGPFGGFFASGFKRAFKIKDFGDIIPGHGGIMDRSEFLQNHKNDPSFIRFDCQFLMATFTNVYIHTFINIPTPGKVIVY